MKKTLKILQTLDVTGHKLLYGVNYVGNTGRSDNTVREIKEIYDRYVSYKSVFGDNKNISGIPELIGRVIKKIQKQTSNLLRKRSNGRIFRRLTRKKRLNINTW